MCFSAAVDKNMLNIKNIINSINNCNLEILGQLTFEFAEIPSVDFAFNFLQPLSNSMRGICIQSSTGDNREIIEISNKNQQQETETKIKKGQRKYR